MVEYHVHVRSTDQFKQVGVREKMTEMRSKVWNIDSCPPVYVTIAINTDNDNIWR